jgi:phenylalanine-4-hydroxylase
MLSRFACRLPAARAFRTSVAAHGTAPLAYKAQASTEQPRISILADISNKPGSLHDILRYFWKYDLNLTRIESRPARDDGSFHMHIDFEGRTGDPNVDKMLSKLNEHANNILILDDKEVPWFPHHVSELDKFANHTLDGGSDLQADHPGFHDQVYITRRKELANIAETYSSGKLIPHIQYTESELGTWREVYTRLRSLSVFACQEYNEILPLMEEHCGYSPDNIPQVQDISNFLMARTGFKLRPVAGLLSSRHFLYGLAFKTFFSTQYIRHPSLPLYTPEPDICHELLGHAPMFADPDFASFSQEIGLASLGASDEDIEKLAACYWYSVEFGVLRETKADGTGDNIRAYGAGLLSSFGELNFSCNIEEEGVQKAQYLPWDPKIAGVTAFPITQYQNTYFVADSLADAKQKMRTYCENLKKPFHARYNALNDTVWVDRAVRRKADDIPQANPYK